MAGNEGITLVLGGARSGKSAFAENMLRETGLKPVYLATGRALDDEMVERIEKHQARRDESWATVEEPLALLNALQTEALPGRAVLVDCLTLWITNLMMAEADVEREIAGLANALGSFEAPVVFVSSEVGQGVVPMDRMSRDFVDYSGLAHQKIAAAAQQVYFVTAGLAQKLK